MPQIRFSRSFSTSSAMIREIEEAATREGVSQSTIINRAIQRYFATKVSRGAWETVSEDEWYDPKNFYTHSSDKQGHSAPVKMQVPKNLAGQISRVIGSGAIPEYRSNQDFYRDAIFHRAHSVGRWIDDGEIVREVTMLIIKSEEDMIAQEARDARDLIEVTQHNIEDWLQRGEIARAREHIKDRMSKASSVPESFREEYMGMLKRLLLQSKARGANLRLVEEIKEPAPKRRGRPRKEVG